MSEPGDNSPDGQPRTTGRIRSLLHHAAGLLQARVSLALIELGEARDAFIIVFVLAIAALVMVSLALIALSALIIIMSSVPWSTAAVIAPTVERNISCAWKSAAAVAYGPTISKASSRAVKS